MKFQQKEKAHNALLKIVSKQRQKKIKTAFLQILESKNFLTITQKESDEALCYFRLNDAEQYLKFQKAIYKAYLVYCIEDKYISINEVMELRQIQKLLQIDPKISKELQNEVSAVIYEEEVEKVIEDGLVERWEREFLMKLKHDILISPERAEAIFAERSGQLIREFIDKILEDQRISPEEEKAFSGLCRSLGVQLEMDEETETAMSIFKLMWQIEFGNIPALRVDFPLNFAEKCYFQVGASYIVMPTEKANAAGAGKGNKHRYAKGIYATENSAPLPSFDLGSKTSEISGSVFLSNQRIWLKGDEEIQFNMEDLMNAESFENGIGIKQGNQWHFFSFENKMGVFTMILNRCLELKEALMEA